MLTRSRSRSQSREGSLAAPDSQSSSGYSSSQSQSQDDSAPTDEYQPKNKKIRRRVHPPQPDQWLCLMPEKTCATCSGNNTCSAESALSFITLCDPRTGSNRRYLWRASGGVDSSGELCEVVKFSDEPRSWFVDNSVQTDGSLLLCTPIDPLFIALPYLQKSSKSGKFTTLEVMLEDAGCSCYHLLSDCVQDKQWQHVCHVKVISDGVQVYKYSKEKAISWLKAKVEAQAVALEEKKVYVGTGSQSSMLVRSKKRSDVSKDDYVRYACGMVCEYLPKELATELESSFGEKLQAEVSEPPAKRVHLEEKGAIATPTVVCNGEPLEDYTKMATLPPIPEPPKPSKMNATQRALAKVDKTGMKSITSFFAPKKKSKI